MGKKWLLFLTILFIALVGCTDQSEYDDEGPKIISEQKNEKELEKDNEQTVTSTRPPGFLVRVGNFNGPPKQVGYCWMKNDCNLSKGNLKELLEEEHAIQANGGSIINFSINGTADYPVEHIVYPDSIEVRKMYKDEETTIEVSNYSMKAPEEPGYHLYHVHAKWEGEEVFGEANYYFKLFVRE